MFVATRPAACLCRLAEMAPVRGDEEQETSDGECDSRTIVLAVRCLNKRCGGQPEVPAIRTSKKPTSASFTPVWGVMPRRSSSALFRVRGAPARRRLTQSRDEILDEC
jgi:hypothetical protein